MTSPKMTKLGFANAEDIDSRRLKAGAKRGVIGRKLRAEVNKVHKLFLLVYDLS